MFVILSLIALATYYLTRFYAKVKRLPPGPTPLPLLGNMHQMALNAIKGNGSTDILKMWSKKYGSIFTIWLGPLPTVHICDSNWAHEAMIKKGVNFADRPDLFLFTICREGRGIIFSSGQHWLEQRRFALHTLRNFGLGRNLMQDRIMLEFDYRNDLLEKEIKVNGGKMSFDPRNLFDVTVGNIINRLLFTDRFTEEKEKLFFTLKKIVDDVTEKLSPIDFMMTKFNSKFFPFNRRYDLVNSANVAMLNFIQQQLSDRKEEIAAGKRDLSNGGEDFVDAYLIEMNKNGTSEIFNEDSLIVTLLDLWFAGQETTTSTLYWAFAYLLANPKTMEKLQKELDNVTGRERPLVLSDKKNTPYLNGVITETLRLSGLLPMNLMRNTSEDTQIGNYFIPKGTTITAEISVIMTDDATFKDTFTDTYSFKPERYIDTNLESKVTAFGIGKRACLGESLARAELYLIIGNLVSMYKISPDPKHPSSHKAITEFGTVRRAKAYQMIIEKRI